MYGLDLFSGIGGISKALEGYVWPVAYCEINGHSRAVLLSRMATGELPAAPIWDDVTSLTGDKLPRVDIIYGGFPCQDISLAGNHWDFCGKGLDGKRSGLFFQIVRLVRELRPKFIFLENVPAIRTRGNRIVGRELASCGYDCRWFPISAKEVGANHLRKRWFLLAYARGERLPGLRSEAGSKESRNYNEERFAFGFCSSDKPIPDEVYARVVRMADGLPDGVDRVRALGNAVVPAQVREAFERLSGLRNFDGNRVARI